MALPTGPLEPSQAKERVQREAKTMDIQASPDAFVNAPLAVESLPIQRVHCSAAKCTAPFDLLSPPDLACVLTIASWPVTIRGTEVNRGGLCPWA
ncbi:hypothetical protein TgHK011_009732 [Trichoderma gracile]|nr:hypothetical protein TgHK011_009732 [Trichoderma gracile]